MIDEYDSIRAGIAEHDLNNLEPLLEDIQRLIHQNPFSTRIKFLLDNPGLATIPVLNSVGENSEPNCLGTAFFIAGVGKFKYPYHAYESELSEHTRSTKTSTRLIDSFFGHPERRIPGAFVFSYHPGIESWHAGIYLGPVQDEHILFSQHGHGKPFGPETLRNYMLPDYYLPRTLAIFNR